MAEVKIREYWPFQQNCDFQCFAGNFDFDSEGSIFGLLTQIFLLVNNWQCFRVVPFLDLNPLFLGAKIENP